MSRKGCFMLGINTMKYNLGRWTGWYVWCKLRLHVEMKRALRPSCKYLGISNSLGIHTYICTYNSCLLILFHCTNNIIYKTTVSTNFRKIQIWYNNIFKELIFNCVRSLIKTAINFLRTKEYSLIKNVVNFNIHSNEMKYYYEI